MGNNWELQNSEILKTITCPCGSGAYVYVRNEYNDDYCRDHTDYDEYCSCQECKAKYEYYKGYWITKEDFVNVKEMEKVVNKLKENTYRKLYKENYNLIMTYFKSKKNLYDFLYEHRLFNVPGTIQTFYRNGVDHYIRNKPYSYTEDFVKLVDLTIGLSTEDNQIIIGLKEKEKTINDFLDSHSVK